MSVQEYKCDICGAPATVIVRDVIQIDSGNGYWIYELAHVPPRVGCMKHPVESKILETK